VFPYSFEDMKDLKTENLTQWVEDFTKDLLQWASRKVSDPELAQDLVQETFLAAAEKFDSFKGESSPKTWLFSILNNKIIDHYRKRMQHHMPFDEQRNPDFFDNDGAWDAAKIPKDWHMEERNLLDDDEFQTVLVKCLEALPEKWNICVKLKYISDKKAEDICQEIGITTSNYWQIIHRAKLQLRDCVEKNWYKN
jgi:RNA polymerase sigma-70 factor (TIGR02943 family)